MKQLLIILLILSLFLVGCGASIADIKENPDEYVGDTVVVSGTTSGSVKLGSLSGFTLTDDNGNKISVSSETLPKDGSKVYVKGTVMKDTLFGTYILAKEVR